MIGNQDSLEESLSARYVEDYMDFVDNVPNDLQRYLTRYREIDVRVQDFLNEAEDLRLEVINAKDSLTKERALDKIEQLLIYIQEMADEKIENIQRLQDSIEKKYCQLNDDSDNLKIEFSKRESVVKEEETGVAGCEPAPNALSQIANETSGQTKKYRRQKDSSDHENTNVPTYDVVETSTKNANVNDSVAAGASSNFNVAASSSMSSSLSSSSSASNLKKNSAGQKRRRRKGRASNAPKDGSPLFDEDLVGEPGEPTYCLCDQISFGEMILCDNDLCPHEWFHFSCVQLSIKPKGKWYCPKCRADKPNVMKPKPLLLKALEKYNKEKEEKMLENGK